MSLSGFQSKRAPKGIFPLKNRETTKAHLRELLFRISMVLKGLDGIVEIAGAICLWVVSPEWLVHVVRMLTRDEIAEDPHDLVANFLRHAAGHFSLSGQHFMAFYLLAHGVVKIFVVAALLRGKLWAYPIAVAVFSAFIVYQTYRFALTESIGLLALTVIDLVVIFFIWLEYRAVRLHPR